MGRGTGNGKGDGLMEGWVDWLIEVSRWWRNGWLSERVVG